VDNKISLQNIKERDRGAVERTVTARLRGSWNNDSGGEYRERPCAYTGIMSAKNSGK
jgi:hypothetical protein